MHLALLNHSDVFKRMPEATRVDATGKPLSSWRLASHHFVVGCYFDGVCPDLTAPWDAPFNARFSARANEYRLPHSPANPLHTNIFAITGPGTGFDDTNRVHIEQLPTDLILLVEVRDSQTHWAAPGDFDIRNMPRTINAMDGRGISGTFPGGFHVAFADGAVWFLRNDTPFTELEKFFTIASVKQHDRDAVLRRYRVRENW